MKSSIPERKPVKDFSHLKPQVIPKSPNSFTKEEMEESIREVTKAELRNGPKKPMVWVED